MTIAREIVQSKLLLSLIVSLLSIPAMFIFRVTPPHGPGVISLLFLAIWGISTMYIMVRAVFWTFKSIAKFLRC